MNNVPPRSHGLLNKSLDARCEMPPYKLLDGEVSKALAIALRFPPELDSKPLLLRIPHS